MFFIIIEKDLWITYINYKLFLKTNIKHKEKRNFLIFFFAVLIIINYHM